ncbi:hypothetical protein BJY52DRAFT_1321067 [Lactarius psammicola]|nr:hypothetical protein BJY52DRAFT_1321067 [Lactarius psammicola]
MSVLRRYICPLNRLYILPFTISSMSPGTVSGCPTPHRVLPSSTSNSQNDSQSPLLPIRMLTQTSDPEVNLLNRADASPSPDARELAEDDCDRRRVENWCGHANVVTLLSALLLITVATFFSRCYMTSWSNPHDILAFYLAQVRKFFGGSSGGATTTVTPPAISFPKPPVTCAVVLTCVLWLASLTVGLGCVVLSTLLRQWIPRYAHVDRPRYGLHSPELLSAFLMQRGSLRDVEAILRVLREWLLVAVFLFLWGLDIRLLHTANSPSPLIIFGLSFTFFTGLCLILAACPRFPSSGIETIPV